MARRFKPWASDGSEKGVRVLPRNSEFRFAIDGESLNDGRVGWGAAGYK